MFTWRRTRKGLEDSKIILLSPCKSLVAYVLVSSANSSAYGPGLTSLSLPFSLSFSHSLLGGTALQLGLIVVIKNRKSSVNNLTN